jgi:putative transport protein
LFLYFAFLILKPKVKTSAGAGLELREILVRNKAISGRTLGEVMTTLPIGVQIVALRRDGRNEPASRSSVLTLNDVVLAVADNTEALDHASQNLGEEAAGHLVKDRADLDYLRVFASRPSVVGRALGDIELPGQNESIVLHVRRGDTDLMARPDLVLEFGDRIGLLANRKRFAGLQKFFGDSIKGTAEFSYISIGLGMAAGFLLGAIPIPLPGLGKFVLGLAGVLIVALVLGKLRRTRGMNWTIPLSANLVLRNLGLTLFLAQVGMSSGPKFAAGVTQTGLLMLGLGAVVLTALVLPVMIMGLLVYRMPFDDVAGIVAGACGNAGILAYTNRLAPTDGPDLGYAMIFPGMTIVKIFFVVIIAKLF